MAETELRDLTHPYYTDMFRSWYKYRLVYMGERAFINQYLNKYSSRENEDDFNLRLGISYSPSFAEAGVNEIKDAIIHRMSDITRQGGSDRYRQAIEKNVDRKGSSMNHFLASKVIPELLFLGKVGVYVDTPVNVGPTLAQNKNKSPYIYPYAAEDIRCWNYDDDNNLISLLLRDSCFKHEESYGFLPSALETRYRLLELLPQGGVKLTVYDESGKGNDPIILDLPKIPFVVMELPHSLLKNIADYQIALLNIASADIIYALKSNFPFYTEQYDPQADLTQFLQRINSDDSPEETIKKMREVIEVGNTQGRRYPKGLERPGFINPSSDPLLASMEKQEQLKREIKILLNLNVSSLQPVKASEASKKQDQSTLESGLAHIGHILATGERQIAEIWHSYESKNVEVTIKYPENYSLRSEEDRQAEAEKLDEIRKQVPSKLFQRELTKRMVFTLLNSKVSQDTLESIYKELDGMEVFYADVQTLVADLENGLVSAEYASTKLRGYPEGEVEKAKKEHAERAARIAQAQSSVTDAQARGVPDMSANSKAGSQEKATSTDTTLDPTVTDKTRGAGK